MFDDIKRLYGEGALSKDGVNNAVKKGWITAEDAELILKEESDNEQNG